MKAIRQFALIVAILLPLVSPAMACALPDTQLTPAERACCKQMATHCGHMQMPMAHGCCQKDVPAANRWIASVPVYVGLSATAGLPVIVHLPLPSGVPDNVAQPALTLPQSPPAVISILRI